MWMGGKNGCLKWGFEPFPRSFSGVVSAERSCTFGVMRGTRRMSQGPSVISTASPAQDCVLCGMRAAETSPENSLWGFQVQTAYEYKPPFTESTCAVMYAASGEARKPTA